MATSPENILTRNRKLWRTYENTIKKYGVISRSIKRRTIYEEVAVEFNIDWKTAGNIICHMTKHPEFRAVD